MFDEVDAGIGGAVAEVVGRKLSELARHHQVMSITHLPQIAEFGRHHFRISKQVADGRTAQPSTCFQPMSAHARLRACSAAKKSFDISIEHARELLGK